MGEKMETVTDFIFLGSKITADGDCSHEILKCLLLGRKAMTNLDRVLKSIGSWKGHLMIGTLDFFAYKMGMSVSQVSLPLVR